MSTKKSNLARQNRLGSFQNLESFCFSIGIGVGSILSTISREKSPFDYEDAIADLGRAAEASGATPELLSLYRGALEAVVATNQAELDSGKK